ncbi:MAG: hypothetical protein V1797_02625 [Pseudomonadota bacterium]
MNRQNQTAMRVIETGLRNHLRASHNRLSGTIEPQAVAAMAAVAGGLAKALGLALTSPAGGRLRAGELTLLRPWLARTTATALAQSQGILAPLALAAAQDQIQAMLHAVTVAGLAGGEWTGARTAPRPSALVASEWRELAVAEALAQAGERFNRRALDALEHAAAAGEDRAQTGKRLGPALAALAADLATIARTLVQAAATAARLAAMAALKTRIRPP